MTSMNMVQSATADISDMVVQSMSPENLLAEKAMITLTKTRYNTNVQKAAASGQLNRVESSMLQQAIPGVAKRIRDHLQFKFDEREARGGKGRVDQYLRVLREGHPERMAERAVTVCFTNIIKERPLRSIAIQIGKEIELDAWETDFDKYGEEVKKGLVKAGTVDKRKLTWKVRKEAERRGHVWEDWSEDEHVRIGMQLISCVLEATNLFLWVNTNETGTDTQSHLVLTEEAQAEIKGMHSAHILLRPKYMPMLCAPNPWVDFDTGCYNDRRLARQLKLASIHSKEHEQLIRDAISNHKMTTVLQALNVIQAVPLKINERVLEVIKECDRQKIAVGKMPQYESFKIPTQAPKGIEQGRYDLLLSMKPAKRPEGFTKGEFAIYRQAVIGTTKRNSELRAEGLQFNQDIQTAGELVGKPFWLPSNLDFRSRTYSVSSFNHQRSDYVRAMFSFHNGMPLGEDGPFWIAVHLANTFDAKTSDSTKKMSKRSNKRRLQWVIEHHEQILKCASDPMGSLKFWMEADQPFNFLSACFEWQGYATQGEAFVSHLPIPLDGSNSGLQHFSMALRDREAGRLVCLTVEDEPQDVYQAVTDNINTKTIPEHLAGESEVAAKYAQRWTDFGITRKICKTPVMTFVYSCSEKGFSKHILKDVMAPLERDADINGGDHPFGDKECRVAASEYLAGVIMRNVEELLPKAAEGMKFFQKCAKALVHESKGVQWTTPSGWIVLNKYMEFNTKKIRGMLFDRETTLCREEGDALDSLTDELTDDKSGVLKLFSTTIRTDPTGKVDKASQSTSISPNVIHSLDASHLHLTCLAASSEGITDLLVIHDSFATHAGNSRRFQQIIKEQFVGMYTEHNVFQEFYDNVKSQLSEEGQVKFKKVKVPQMGSLDPAEVLQSEYAFA